MLFFIKDIHVSRKFQLNNENERQGEETIIYSMFRQEIFSVSKLKDNEFVIEITHTNNKKDKTKFCNLIIINIAI